eukprot:754284-Hanusia_phi.AAC.3
MAEMTMTMIRTKIVSLIWLMLLLLSSSSTTTLMMVIAMNGVIDKEEDESLPGGKEVLVSDTIEDASLILHVVDASSPLAQQQVSLPSGNRAADSSCAARYGVYKASLRSLCWKILRRQDALRYSSRCKL